MAAFAAWLAADQHFRVFVIVPLIERSRRWLRAWSSTARSGRTSEPSSCLCEERRLITHEIVSAHSRAALSKPHAKAFSAGPRTHTSSYRPCSTYSLFPVVPFAVMERFVDAMADNGALCQGHCRAGVDLRLLWRAGSQGDEENQLQWISVPN
jgi:hypothetical protein